MFISPRPRIETIKGSTEKFKTGCGNLYVTVNFDEFGICEVFTNTGRTGGCPSQTEATARVISISLRSGVAPMELINQLKGIRCSACIGLADLKCLSCPDAIGRALERAVLLLEKKRK